MRRLSESKGHANATCFKWLALASVPFSRPVFLSLPLSSPTDGSVGARLWQDLNGNGLLDNGEPGLSGVTVQLWQGTAVVNTAKGVLP